jgi:hypothetical protein
MSKRLAVLIAGLILVPVGAEAAACKLENATFRPRYSAERFEIRSSRVGGNPIFDLTVRRTGETFRFRVNASASTGGGTITSVPDGAGQDPGIRTDIQLSDAKGLKITPAGEIGHVSFYDLGRAFVDFRMRTSRTVEPYTSPPSGVWRVSGCRPD